MIDYFNCSITGVRLQLSDYSCIERLVKNKAVNAPITFKEIVMNMIMPHVS